MPFELSPERRERLEALLGRYPNRGAACLPLLHLAQEERGVIDDDIVAFVARTLDIPAGRVAGVASFYTMYRRKTVGRYHVQICTNLSCSLAGVEQVREAIAKEIGVRPGETTRDGLFTLTEVECLASCGTAPVMQVNDEYHERLTPESARRILRDLRAGAAGGA